MGSSRLDSMIANPDAPLPARAGALPLVSVAVGPGPAGPDDERYTGLEDLDSRSSPPGADSSKPSVEVLKKAIDPCIKVLDGKDDPLRRDHRRTQTGRGDWDAASFRGWPGARGQAPPAGQQVVQEEPIPPAVGGLIPPVEGGLIPPEAEQVPPGEGESIPPAEIGPIPLRIVNIFNILEY